MAALKLHLDTLSREVKDHITPISQVLAPIKLNPNAAGTALATRTTKDVIADLKRPNNMPQTGPHKHRKNSISFMSGSSLTHDQNGRHDLDGLMIDVDHIPPGDEKEPENEYEDDDDDDEIRPASKPRIISERKRRQNIIAESYMQNALEKSLKAGIAAVKPGEEAMQSARWLVNQSESHQIISTPREYQVELFDRAKVKNIIAVLDTGSGKTLIAVLLLRHVFSQELEDRALGKPKRISFFLVDSVTLVFQQHAVLKANLDQPMDMFCGDMGVDLWNREQWKKHFSKNMVIVCTAEVLRQCLHHSFISMDQINLLIFDEAHHAKKDHAYARIIKDFYVTQEKHLLLPKIFGMTASPVDSKTDVRKAAAELEGLLHSEIATAGDADLSGFKITSEQEKILIYESLNPKFETPLYQQMRQNLEKNTVFRKPLTFALQASRELGLWCADEVWPFCLAEEESKKLIVKTERHYHSAKIKEPMHVLEELKRLVEQARDIVKSHFFEEPNYIPHEGNMTKPTSTNLSSKVVALVDYLRQRFERPTEDKAIVFVQQRYTARLLARLFSHSNIGTPYLRVGTLVGTRTGEAGDLNVSFREQVITMMNFRKGALNCLFATSVAEEGLDIPDCNLVVRFDLYTTLIQYIQSRGRARHANSRFVHMMEKDNHAHVQIVREVRQNENILAKFCRALPEDRKLTGGDYDIDHFLSKEKKHRVYKVPETGAKLTYKMSLMVLANFVDSLLGENTPNAEYIVTIQNKQYICEVILPESAPIHGAVGRPHTTKAVAKCSAAFEACVLLREGAYLDEHLLPIYTKQLPAMRNALLAVDSKAKESFHMRTKPELWTAMGDPEELFVTVLVLDSPESLDCPSQPLALLTKSPIPELPSFFLHFGPDSHSSVQPKSLSRALKVDAALLQQFNRFTLCIFYDVFSKEFEEDASKMSYFLAPIKAHGLSCDTVDPADIIAWDILAGIKDEFGFPTSEHRAQKVWKNRPSEFYQNKFLVDPYDGSRKMFSVKLAPQYHQLDPVPANSAPRKGTKQRKLEFNKNIMEYSISLFSQSRARAVFEDDQPVVEAAVVSQQQNFLDEFVPVDSDEKPRGCFVILEPLKISPLPAAVVAMAYLFPAIVHRIESYLIALDACKLLHLDIRPDLALESMTKDSDNSDEHGEEKINFQRGMGNNYERLEFLGDCFLKMATSISLYSIHPDNDEYAYHVDRMMLICNKNLRNNAVKLKLYEYIRSHSFSRRSWYPEGLKLLKGKTAKAPDTAKLGDKTIADVCEALIGAALLSTTDMDNAVRAVTELVSSENHQITEWAEYYKLYKKPKYQTAPVTQMQLNMAMQIEEQDNYHFKYPRLLRSAFTHPSYPYVYEQIPSYQRLEFLGDSLLDMACINYLFHNFPGRDPQWLTEHKMAMVSNQFLGALCVALGWHTHLCIFNATFNKQITEYVQDVQEARRQAEDEAVRAGKSKSDCAPDYWTQVRPPPKCLPDIVEAYVGAIFVDSEYDYSQVERFFNDHILWYFKDMYIYDTFANKHPTTFLTKFLHVEMGCMDWTIKVGNVPNIDGSKPKVMAMVMVHDKVIADKTSESSRYAKVGAAQLALAILKGLPLPEFREKYGCNCRLDEALAEEGVHENDETVQGTLI